MTSVDSTAFLSSENGYLQKGRNMNIREADIERKVSDLLPSRQVSPLGLMVMTTMLMKPADGFATRRSSSSRSEAYFRRQEVALSLA
jgi:hypothetical protein